MSYLARLCLRTLPIAALAAAFCVSAQTPGDFRVALVIGNGAYTSVPALPNPSNDAIAMSEALTRLGFTVIQVRDASKPQMADAIVKVRERLQGKQGIGMLYYAGHGLQMDARNYMVPVDAKLSKGTDVPQQTVEVGSVIEAFKAAGNRMNILVLDACRDNPFGGITTGKGLAPLDAPSGTLLAYATAPGNVAEDGSAKGGNGLYTQYLLEELKKPQARIEDVFKRVRLSVRKASGGRQIPWESTSLEEDFLFNDGRIVAVARPSVQTLTASFDEEKQAWNRISASTKPDDFYAFLQKYPNGTITEAATARLNQLSSPTLVVQGSGADGSDRPYTRPAYRVGDEFESAFEGSALHLTQSVTSVSDREIAMSSRIVINGKESGGATVELFDPSGGSRGIKGMFSYDPPQMFFPADLMQVGKSWKIGFEARGAAFSSFTSHTATGEARVLGREVLRTPAGEFATFKVETTITQSINPDSPTRCEFWLSPDVPVAVRMMCEMPVKGKATPGRTVTTLVRVKRAA